MFFFPDLLREFFPEVITTQVLLVKGFPKKPTLIHKGIPSKNLQEIPGFARDPFRDSSRNTSMSSCSNWFIDFFRKSFIDLSTLVGICPKITVGISAVTLRGRPINPSAIYSNNLSRHHRQESR